MFWAILLSLSPAKVWSLEIAFLSASPTGQAVELETDGIFFHTAVRVGDQWLHAHTLRGVELIDDLKPFANKIVILRDETLPEPSAEFVASVLGLPFDMSFRWYDKLSTYCTRLIVDAINAVAGFDIQPRPADFSGPYWHDHERPTHGEPGLSPDELFAELVARGFWPVSRCEEFLGEL